MAVRTPEREQTRLRRREEPEVRRAQILAAARACFASSGFKTTTVDDIADEAGVSVGLLYRVFGSKTAIIEAIIIEQVEQQIEQAYAIISSSVKSGINRAKVLERFDDKALDLQALALTFEMAAEACRDTALRKFMQERREALQVSLIKRLIDEGMNAKTARAMFAELGLIGAVASGAIIQNLANPTASLSQSVREVFRSLEGGPRKRD